MILSTSAFSADSPVSRHAGGPTIRIKNVAMTQCGDAPTSPSCWEHSTVLSDAQKRVARYQNEDAFCQAVFRPQARIINPTTSCKSGYCDTEAWVGMKHAPGHTRFARGADLELSQPKTSDVVASKERQMLKRFLLTFTFIAAVGAAGLGLSSVAEARGYGHRNYAYGAYGYGSSYPATAAFGYGPGVFGFGPTVSIYPRPAYVRHHGNHAYRGHRASRFRY